MRSLLGKGAADGEAAAGGHIWKGFRWMSGEVT